MSEDVQEPKIEFPCDYPIKIMGRSCDHFKGTVLEIVEEHSPDYDRTSVVMKDSSKGTWVSMTVTIIATGETQLEALHSDLKNSGIVKMVL
jgi:putative lipoic acid-binding regulatory protein